MEFLMNFGALSGKILLPLSATVLVMYIVGMLLIQFCGMYVKNRAFKRKTIFSGFNMFLMTLLSLICNILILLSKVGFVASFIFLGFYLVSLAL